MDRRAVVLVLVAAFFIGGCTLLEKPTVRSQSPEDDPAVNARLVGDMAVPTGMHAVRVEAIGLVTGLAGTGSDPGPSPQRAVLIDEMKARGVHNPNALLASKNVSLVLVQAWLRPGIQKGDRFDVELRVPNRSETKSLRGGYLLETRLKEMAALPDGMIHTGHEWGIAQGPVLVDPAADGSKDLVSATRGRVLAGGVCLRSRKLGLVLLPEHQSVFNSSRIANAVNRRFYTFDRGIQTGVATAKTDNLIDLTVHPRYKDNVARYMAVVRSIALEESETERVARLRKLEQYLLDPDTAPQAALQLEAIGPQAVPVLKKGLGSPSVEVQFYAAEALAYMDEREAAEPLGRIARQEPAFRVFALTALSTMNEFAAYEQLRDMLSLSSAETRYGAFRALWTMNPKDPLVAGEKITSDFGYHVLDVGGPPMIHVTRNRRPEVVIFGKDQRFATPLVLNAGNNIMITTVGPNELSVAKFAVGQADQKRIVSTRVDEVLRAVIELGGTYPDIVQALQEAKAAGVLPGRFEVDALPEAGRTYQRVAAAGSPAAAEVAADSPAPELFEQRGKQAASTGDPMRTAVAANSTAESDDEPKGKSSGSWLRRILRLK